MRHFRPPHLSLEVPAEIERVYTKEKAEVVFGLPVLDS